MKNYTKNLFLFLALVIHLDLIQAQLGRAQTLTTLHSFTAVAANGSNGDGANPNSTLIMSSGVVYGSTGGGGKFAQGTLFKLNTDGSGFMTLYNFNAGSEGGNGEASLIVSNTLFGTTYGISLYANPPPTAPPDFGTVFKVKIDGTGFTTLYSFNNGTDGASPIGGLTLSGNTLYGTAGGGSPKRCIPSEGGGTVFSINTDGTGFRSLYNFTGGTDGDTPYTGLVLADSTLYGTALDGGSSNCSSSFGT